MCSSPFSHTRWSVGSKGRERGGLGFCGPDAVEWGGSKKGKETPPPLQPEFTKYSFLAKYLWLNFKISIWPELAYLPSLNELLDIKRNPNILSNSLNYYDNGTVNH